VKVKHFELPLIDGPGGGLEMRVFLLCPKNDIFSYAKCERRRLKASGTTSPNDSPATGAGCFPAILWQQQWAKRAYQGFQSL
jgi:hypothetical protein